MKMYIYTILSISVIAGIVKALVSSFDTGIKRHLNYLIGLICAIAILSPLVAMVSDITKAQQKIEGFFNDIVSEEKINSSNQIIINTGAEKIADGIKSTVANKFNLNEKEIFVEVKIDDENINSLKILYINVYLGGKASWSNAEKIQEYLEDLIGCEIHVKRR